MGLLPFVGYPSDVLSDNILGQNFPAPNLKFPYSLLWTAILDHFQINEETTKQVNDAESLIPEAGHSI